MTPEHTVSMKDAYPTMFGVPRWEPDTPYDVVFVGVPTDSGGLGHRSPASAPAFLRTAASLFPSATDDEGRSAGWFDYVEGRTLLAGLRLADAGDLACTRGGGAGQLECLSDVYATLRGTARQLVIMGGDHSIAYGLARSLRHEALVWVDAHEDARPKDGPYPDCANVVRYIDELENVPVIAQYGLRGLVPSGRAEPPKKRTLCRSVAEVVASLDAFAVRSAALTIDVDVLDPSILPAVGSPSPEGLRPSDLLDLVTGLRNAGVRVPVIELAEFAPTSEHDIASGLVLVNLLLRALSRCLEPARA